MNIRRGDFDSDYFTNCWSYLGGYGNVDLVAIILEADKACLAVELIALNGSTKRLGIVVQANDPGLIPTVTSPERRPAGAANFTRSSPTPSGVICNCRKFMFGVPMKPAAKMVRGVW